MQASQPEKVPQYLHWIWIGINKIRDDYKLNILYSMMHNPNYSSCLWTSSKLCAPDVLEDLRSFCQIHNLSFIDINSPACSFLGDRCYENFILIRKPLFKQYVLNLDYLMMLRHFSLEAAMADIFRYEILYLYGVVYCDMDNRIVDPLGELMPEKGIFVQPLTHLSPNKRTRTFILNNNFIMVVPRHFIFKNLINAISMSLPCRKPLQEVMGNNYERRQWLFSTVGPFLYTQLIVGMLSKETQCHFDRLVEYKNRPDYTEEHWRLLRDTPTELDAISSPFPSLPRNHKARFRIGTKVNEVLHIVLVDKPILTESLKNYFLDAIKSN